MLDDCRNALRQWRRAPGATAVALLSLALGIGGTLAIFSLVDALILRELPVAEPQRLLRLVARDIRPGEQTDTGVATHVWEHIRGYQRIIDPVLAVAVDRVNLSRSGDGRPVGIAYVSGDYFQTLGLTMVLGRPLRADDEAAGARAAVISHSLWQRQFGGRADVIGQPLYLDQHRFDVVGVAPRGFFGLEVGRIDDVMVSLAAQDIIRGSTSQRRAPASAWLQLYGRVTPERTLDEAAAAFRAWYPVLREQTARADVPRERHIPYQLDLTPAAYGRSYVRRQYTDALTLLLAAVGVLLLIASVNLAVLVTARFSDRRHEIGVRISLGATRWRIVRLLLTDTMLVAALGGIGGLWLGHTLATLAAPLLTLPGGNAPRTELLLALDGRLIAMAVLLTLVSASIAGPLPATRSAKLASLASLSDASRTGGGGRRTLRTMRTLAGGQVACAVVLLAGGALLVRSFVEMTTRPAGVDIDRVLVAVTTDPYEPTSPAAVLQRLERIRGALTTVPGVTAVSAGLITPLSGMMSAAALRVPGSLEQVPTSGYPPFNYVLPGYFRALGTPVLRGRDFTDMDVVGGPTPQVAIVNQAFAERHFGGFSALGRPLMLGERRLEIVGVVANARAMSLREDRTVAMAYGPFGQWTSTRMPNARFVVRADDPERVGRGVVSTFRALDPRILVDLRTLRDEALATVHRDRLLAWVATVLAALGLLIAVLGIYGTFAYAVDRRRLEIGVRLALGADSTRILRMVLAEAAVVVGLGAAIGTLAALLGVRALESVLFGISARDALTIGLACGCMLVAGGIATFIPARRAASALPAVALRWTEVRRLTCDC